MCLSTRNDETSCFSCYHCCSYCCKWIMADGVHSAVIMDSTNTSPPARVDVLQQCPWQSSIFNYDSNTSIIHSSIKSLDLQDGHWIECQCKHTKHLIMRRPFEHGNFTTHLLTHALAPSSQMSIRSFFQLPSACSSQRPPLRATEAIRHRVALLQQPLYTTPSPCIGSLFCQLMHTSSTNSSCCQSMEGEHAWVS